MSASPRHSVAVVFGYGRRLKYSVNVLVGAIEKVFSKDIAVVVTPVKDVPQAIAEARQHARTVVYGQTLITPELPAMLGDILNAVRAARKFGAIPVAGGPHATGDPYGTLISLGFEIVFLGDAEETFTEFIGRLADGGDPKGIRRGIAYLEDGRPVVKGLNPLKNLDRFPAFAVAHRMFNPIEITRGCPHACKYCQVSYSFGAFHRHRSLENVTQHVRILRAHGLRDLRFITPNALAYGSEGRSPNLSAVDELITALQEFRREGARVFLGAFPSEVRPEFVTEESVELLKGRVDNKKVIVGAQSGSARLLKEMNRGHTPEDVINAVELLTEAGFRADVDYIFGLPHEEGEDIEETLRHIEKVVSLGGRVHAHVFLPLPGTPYAMEPPGRIPEWLRRRLFKLIGRGSLYGQWESQERLAAEVARLRDEGIIIVRRDRAELMLSRLKRGRGMTPCLKV